MDKRITLNYIKGFFDGEGCVSVTGKQIIITNQCVEILDKIHEKLKSVKIDNHLVSDKNCYRLKVFGYHNLCKFHKLVGSNIQTKEKQMIKLINSYSNIILSQKEKERIKNLRKKGYSYRKIAKKTNVNLSGVYTTCLKN